MLRPQPPVAGLVVNMQCAVNNLSILNLEKKPKKFSQCRIALACNLISVVILSKKAKECIQTDKVKKPRPPLFNFTK